jgi:hypothetical protein
MASAPVYSSSLLELLGFVGSYTIPAIDQVTIIRDGNFYCSKPDGSECFLQGVLGEAVWWVLLSPISPYGWFDEKHVVIPPGQTMSISVGPGETDVSLFGYTLLPPPPP